jgi:hypothetical protein
MTSGLIVACNNGYERLGASTVLMPGRAEDIDILSRGEAVTHKGLDLITTTHTPGGCRWGARRCRCGSWGHRANHTTTFGRCAGFSLSSSRNFRAQCWHELSGRALRACMEGGTAVLATILAVVAVKRRAQC